MKKFEFWIDRGGTFTDIVTKHPNGALSSRKYLSENPGQYEDAAVHAMREIMDVPIGAPFPAEKVSAIKMGTTVATNALLERNGEPTLLMITKGFGDALLIGQQHRQALFALKPERPTPLYQEVVEIAERIDAKGNVIQQLNKDACHSLLKAAFETGLRSVAIVFMHAYRYPEHEKIAGKIAEKIGFPKISLSHQTSPLMKLIPRGDTTVADAYLSPILKQYVSQVEKATKGAPLYFMQSNGGLTAAWAFEGKDAVLSGPAGGIVGAAKTGKRAGHHQLIGFDMGGTSTDVSHFSGTYERVFDTLVAGVRMTVPMMDIHTVAAGGGSVCRFEDGRFQVGPASAGAYPGPAAYGRGGPITVTDCNLLLGKLSPDLFPKVFGDNGKSPLNIDAVQSGFEKLQNQIHREIRVHYTLEEIAEGFLQVAVGHMARAIKRVSVERGHDIKKYSLLTFGGAGGQHACLVADALSISTVIVPPFSGVLSALGMGLADQSVIIDKAIECPLDESETLQRKASQVRAEAGRNLSRQNIKLADQTITLKIRAKYKGTDTPLSIPYGTYSSMRIAFEKAHEAQFGFVEAGQEIIAEAIEAEATGGGARTALNIRAEGLKNHPETNVIFFSAGKQRRAKVFQRETLVPDLPIAGPAIILEKGGTTIVEPGWTALLTQNDTLKLKRTHERTQQKIELDRPNPIMLEVFNNLFMSVAEEMGGVLARTAHSVNVKERLDFSCAVFDKTGHLIANAPHMPVHLGSMGESVSSIIHSRGKNIAPGDVFMLNDPFSGGTHLPDITVVTPVFLEDDNTPVFYVASRGHHADIGGISPGSMPAHSKTIEEEGIRFSDFLLASDGKFREKEIRQKLEAGIHPARNPDQNIADLKAQVASNERGVALVKKLVLDFGRNVVDAYMQHIQNNAEEAVRRAIERIKGGSFCYSMDCGATIKVKVILNSKTRSATVDFTGTSPVQDNNFNAPLAVTKAAVLYVFRTLTGEDIPLNAGCLKPITMIVPAGCFLNPAPPAAVVAGNVETSQAVTNALFLATGTMAGAQGTMNNLTFGNKHYQYYETIAGGTGAGPNFNGTDAIQSHMTNSRLTDPEVLEWRYPVLVEDFGVRKDSGGNGLNNGGNGAQRTLRFLESMEVSILSNHRLEGPPGLAGGGPGKPGSAIIIRKDGTQEPLKASDSAHVYPDDSINIETPGGGGYGTQI